MTTLKTITTIELSNDCQLACRYCINRDMETKAGRQRIIMSEEVFAKTLGVLRVLCEAGTQAEVNMNGNGESFLDPSLFSRIRRVKEVVGKRIVNMSTNGLIMSDEVAQALKASGLDSIQISIHRPEAARRASQILITNGMPGAFNFGAVQSGHNWAGQIEEERYQVRLLPHIVCHPLIEGRGYVSAEGFVSPCCYDYRLLGAFGHIGDVDLFAREITPFELCRTCHQQIPEPIKKQYGVEQAPLYKFDLKETK